MIIVIFGRCKGQEWREKIIKIDKKIIVYYVKYLIKTKKVYLINYIYVNFYLFFKFRIGQPTNPPIHHKNFQPTF